MVAISLAKAGRKALDLLYPPRCAVCGRYGAFVCETCLEALPRAEGSRCARCWLPQFLEECANCAVTDSRLSQIRSVYRYEGEARRVVRAFKFGGQSSLAPFLGTLMADAYARHGLHADVVVPVPLTGMKQRQRGYNQALLLAREVARACDVPCVQALRRTGIAEPQTAAPSAEQRWLNVQGVFALAKPEAVQSRHVLLIDDVATTGSTLEACAGILLEGGALSVAALTLARED